MPRARAPRPRGAEPNPGARSRGDSKQHTAHSNERNNRQQAAGSSPPGGARPPSSIVHPPSSGSSADKATPGGKPPAPRRPSKEPRPGYVAVGRVLGPFGLKGEMKVQSLTDNAERFAPKARLWADEQPVTVAASREAAGHLYVRLKGFPDRTSVEKFRQALLQVPESDLPPLPEGEYYRFQLVGLTVVDREGQVLGTLDEVIETGANDVYRVRTPDGGDMLLPALADVIVSVDLDAQRMVADPPEWR